jgi:TPR repeat protein
MRLVWVSVLALVATSLMIVPAHAGLDADFPACRRQILNIGSDPKGAVDQYCLGLSHAFALNHPKNQAEGAKWFRKAAEQGHPGAQATLGYMYERGYGVRADPAEAAKWYRKAADQNHDDGLFNLGRAYEHGVGVSKDLSQARAYYTRAAAAGSTAARGALAQLGKGPEPPRPGQGQFDEGVRLYQAKDYTGAVGIFMKLAGKGDPKAQLQIGYQYQYGEGLKKSSEEAARWYRKSADQGNAAAQSNLGSLYEDGQGVKEDWVEAAEWYRKSAEQGAAAGQFSLGRAYQFGIGVPQNRQEAVRWFDKAGDQGHDQANYFANHLKQRGTYVGFRNEEEHAVVVGQKLRMVLLAIEPVGRTFRISAERMAFLRQASQKANREESYLRWSWLQRDYENCKRAGRSNCSDPGPAP